MLYFNRKFLKILKDADKILKDADINTNNVYELKVFARLVQQKLIWTILLSTR